MKERKYQRKLPGSGDHLGLFIKKPYSTGKVSDPEKMEEAMKEWFEMMSFDPELLLSETEEFFVQLVEDYGINIKKPYSFCDMYKTGKQSQGDIVTVVKSKAISLIGDDQEIITLAVKILECCYSLRRAITGENISGIIRGAMLLQHNITVYQLVPWERPARVGEAQIEAGHKGTKYTETEKSNWLERYKKLSAEGHSDRSAAAIIESETSATFSSIRHHISKKK